MARIAALSNLSLDGSGSATGDGDANEIHGAESTAASSLYWIQPVQELPRVDLSATIASRLLCIPSHDQRAFDTRLVRLVDRWLVTLQLLTAVCCPALLCVFFARDRSVQTVASFVSLVFSLPLTIVALAMFSWDLTRLLVRTFEFWFLTFVNLTNTVVFFSLFRDVRVLAIVASSLFYQLTLFADANLRTRLIELRFLVFGSPATVAVVIACVLRITPNLNYTTFHILGTTIDDVDLLINGNFIIGFFTALKTHRNRHLLSAKHEAARRVVQCQMVFPTCCLAPSTRHTVKRLREKTVVANHAFALQKSMSATQFIQSLHLVQSAVADAIDVDHTLFKRLILPATLVWQSVVVITLLAIIGLVGTSITYATSTLGINTPTRGLFPLSVTALVATASFTSTYAAHYQRDLLRMLLLEVDVWFAAVHFTIVAVCLADIVNWDHHRILSVASVWLWSLWIVLLDAVPPSTRQRLGFQR
jgi:hypothetical protein